MSTVTTKGQVTLPKKLRDAIGLKPGSEVEFELDGGRILVRKRAPTEILARWRGRYEGKLLGETVDETMDLLRGERPPRDPEPT
ncbi:MAG TPA: AbrB/MazE/SpoVT family DNA-binding domain-containing protein [Chloroflexota bacterium]|nr:AbrB/MazE/SpoVT family DNA-binding domain-containing protein [Chloroflexota bacterium]